MENAMFTQVAANPDGASSRRCLDRLAQPIKGEHFPGARDVALDGSEPSFRCGDVHDLEQKQDLMVLVKPPECYPECRPHPAAVRRGRRRLASMTAVALTHVAAAMAVVEPCPADAAADRVAAMLLARDEATSRMVMFFAIWPPGTRSARRRSGCRDDERLATRCLALRHLIYRAHPMRRIARVILK